MNFLQSIKEFFSDRFPLALRSTVEKLEADLDEARFVSACRNTFNEVLKERNIQLAGDNREMFRELRLIQEKLQEMYRYDSPFRYVKDGLAMEASMSFQTVRIVIDPVAFCYIPPKWAVEGSNQEGFIQTCAKDMAEVQARQFKDLFEKVLTRALTQSLTKESK